MSKSYLVGDAVDVRIAYPPGHIRAPFFIRGKSGTIDQVVGDYHNPEELAYGRKGTEKLMLYRVRFNQKNVWSNYTGPSKDSLIVDIYENWLKPNEGALK